MRARNKSAIAKLTLAILIAFFITTYHASSIAQVYKCVDATGKTTFSNIGCSSSEVASPVTIHQANTQDNSYVRQQIVEESFNEVPQRPTFISIGGSSDNDKYAKKACDTLKEDILVGKPMEKRMLKSQREIAVSMCNDYLSERDRKRFCDKALDATLNNHKKRLPDRLFKSQLVAATSLCNGKPMPVSNDEPAQGALPTKIITHCDSGVCYDNYGKIYNHNGDSNFISQDGQACQNMGDIMHCH